MTNRRLRYLKSKRFCVQLLRYLKLIPDIWYDCEIEIARYEGEKLAEFFNKKAEQPND